MTAPKIRIVGLVFPGFNVMDLTGPMEVFGHSQHAPETREIHIASATDVTKSAEGVNVKRDLSFIELLANQTGGLTQLSTYDVLVVPGSPLVHLQAALNKDEGLLRVIKTFAQLKAETSEKWLFSVCSGAGFLGAAGLFAGRTVTTHWAYFDVLREICAKADTKVDVVRKRFVDVGQTDAGVKLVTAGGVSCGIDAALWISSQIHGIEKARTISKYMDYDWKFGGVEVTEGWLMQDK